MSFTMDVRGKIDRLAGLMDEFRLSEAEMEGENWKVAFKRQSTKKAATPEDESVDHLESFAEAHFEAPAAVISQGPVGEPVLSPMTGIYYGAPSPSAAPFVVEGDHVEEGQVLALIEAMKTFNEITAPCRGVVTQLVAKNSDLVQQKDVLMYLEEVGH